MAKKTTSKLRRKRPSGEQMYVRLRQQAMDERMPVRIMGSRSIYATLNDGFKWATNICATTL